MGSFSNLVHLCNMATTITVGFVPNIIEHERDVA